MNFSSLSAADRRLVIVGGLVALIALISFVDPSGSWGAVMILSLLGGLLAVFVAMQPQIAPTMKLPTTRGLTLLVAGGAAVLGYAIAMLTYLGYITRNFVDIFVLLMIVGLIASIFLAWSGWQAYQAEPKVAGAAAAPGAAPAATPGASAATPGAYATTTPAAPAAPPAAAEAPPVPAAPPPPPPADQA